MNVQQDILMRVVFREMEEVTRLSTLRPPQILHAFARALHQYAVLHGLVDDDVRRAQYIRQLLAFDVTSSNLN